MVPGDVAAGAGLVLDDHGLAERLAQLLDDLPGERVGRSARRKCDDEADRAIGIGGGLRVCGRGAEHGDREREQANKVAHDPSLPCTPVMLRAPIGPRARSRVDCG